VPETPSQNPADNRENRQGIQNKGNHNFLSIRARRTPNGSKRRDSSTTKGVVTQPVRAEGTGLPVAGNMLMNGMFMTIGSNVRRSGGLVRCRIYFDLFRHLVNANVKHRALSFRWQIANTGDFVWFVFHKL
jgi:hypothetical protein